MMNFSDSKEFSRFSA